jgi:hypothetical protein
LLLLIPARLWQYRPGASDRHGAGLDAGGRRGENRARSAYSSSTNASETAATNRSVGNRLTPESSDQACLPQVIPVTVLKGSTRPSGHRLRLQ